MICIVVFCHIKYNFLCAIVGVFKLFWIRCLPGVFTGLNSKHRITNFNIFVSFSFLIIGKVSDWIMGIIFLKADCVFPTSFIVVIHKGKWGLTSIAYFKYKSLTGFMYLVDSQDSATCGDMIQFKEASF
jgi:hypothetical protein